MTPESAFAELLGRVGANHRESVTVSNEELSEWPPEAVMALKGQGLLRKSRPAQSVICPGCERECSMPVHTVTRANSPAGSFVVCDKRSDINRVTVPHARLTLWRCDANAVLGFVATSLELIQTTVQPSALDLLPIGMARGNHRSQMLNLRVQAHLNLVAGSSVIPLQDFIHFADGKFAVDRTLIRQLVDAANTADPRHTPSTVKREARKVETQEMYSGWKKEYKALKKRRPNMSDVWYSEQIAKSAAGCGRDASTIKKNMKS